MTHGETTGERHSTGDTREEFIEDEEGEKAPEPGVGLDAEDGGGDLVHFLRHLDDAET